MIKQVSSLEVRKVGLPPLLSVQLKQAALFYLNVFFKDCRRERGSGYVQREAALRFNQP